MTSLSMERDIVIPELALVALVGISSSGKSSFAKTHFLDTEIVSSDRCRGIVSNDENSMEATKDAFELVDYIVRKRLQRGLLTVIDATHVQRDSRKSILKAARDYHCMPVAIVVNTPMDVCLERHSKRPDRDFSPQVLKTQQRQLKSTLKQLKREGFRYIYRLDSLEDISNAKIVRQPMWTDKKALNGPFDIIGDIHGCFDELVLLLEKLGYVISKSEDGRFEVVAPESRQAFFVGDLVDRGPKNVEVLRLVMDMVSGGSALCVPGNHDVKLQKHLAGRSVKLTHGLEVTAEEMARESEGFRKEVSEFVDKLVGHLVLDDGKLVVAHAGMKEEYQGRGSGVTRTFALYGETTGETDEYGLPVRYNWAQDYRGKALVVYGHTPVPEAEFYNNTICVDTGCVFGGTLTALKYPEKELVSVDANEVYYEPIKPLVVPDDELGVLSSQQLDDENLYLEDVTGKRFISVQDGGNVKIEADRSASALEVMSRYSVHPKWINYLPPTMSPPSTSKLDDYLEHPNEAFRYFKEQGIEKVVCEEKHMGSRAVIQIAKDIDAARRVYGVMTDEQGIVYTRSGRRFFNDAEMEASFLSALSEAITSANVWDDLNTEWLTLDCEIMPWSMKAIELIKQQYAAVGCAAGHAHTALNDVLEKVADRGHDVQSMLERSEESLQNSISFRKAYKNYCWDVSSLTDIKVAPFHILASEGSSHTDKDHTWHMNTIAKIADANSDLLIKTQYQVVSLSDQEQLANATDWWLSHTESLGEGMVVKPFNFIEKGRKGIVQPALKVRGREYLRIIYGMDYLQAHNLIRLKDRGLGTKRRLAFNEFKLGVESLRRFVKHDPLRHVHECAFAVLALQSEPVDPRL